MRVLTDAQKTLKNKKIDFVTDDMPSKNWKSRQNFQMKEMKNEN